MRTSGTVFAIAVMVTALIGSASEWSGRPGGRVHAQSAAPMSVLEGVYTEEQVKRGQALYEKQCVLCHGEKLDGGIAPGLTGEEFLKYWDTKPLGEMVEKMRMSMPADDPGRMTAAEAADLMALILNKNMFPAGQKELASEMEILNQIRFARPQ
jgi:mono/diheme cytochrome c family protein